MKCNCKRRGARLKQAGFGLIEILISTSIVSVLALSVAFYSSTTELTVGDTAKANFDCLNHSVSVLDEVLSRGGPTRVPPYSTAWHPWMGAPTWSVSQTSNPPDVTNIADAGLLAQSYVDSWPASAPAILSQTGSSSGAGTSEIYAANALFIDDRTRFLSAIYNNPTVDYCSGFQSNTQFQTIAHAISGNNLDNLSTQVQVQAYDLNTGNLVPCSERPLWLHPRNRTNPSGTNAAKVDGFHTAQPKFRKPVFPSGVNYRNDRGFIVSIRTTFLDSKENTKACTYTQRIAQQMDDVPPPRPSISLTVTEPGGPTAAPAHRNTAQLQIDADGAGTFERGTVLICRDRSLNARKLATVQCYYNPNTMASPGPGPQPVAPIPALAPRGRIREISLLNGDANDLAAVGMGIQATFNNGTALAVPATMTALRPTSWGTQDWVRCEQLRLCGSAPTGPAAVTFVGDAPTITLNYSNLRSECVVRVEVAAMDAAGNLHNDTTASATFNPSKLATARVISTFGGAYDSLITPRPLCGAYCTPNATWPVGDTGYYVAEGGCCVGVGCIRGRNNNGANLTESTDPAPL